jgi:hypothetical protein
MPFTIDDFHDLIRLLEERPEWRQEMRRLVLTDALLALPEQFAEFRTTTEQRFQEFAVAQKQTAEHVQEFAKAQQRTDERLSELADTVRILADGVGHLKGEALENRYRTKGLPYFSRLLRHTHVLSEDELRTLVEGAIDRGVLSDEQAEDIYEVDVIVHGVLKHNKQEAYLVVDVSWGVGPDDVARAMRRASLLAQAVALAVPVVAGVWITPEGALLARQHHTWQLAGGRAIPPDSVSQSS